jgi:hypothetical protein
VRFDFIQEKHAADEPFPHGCAGRRHRAALCVIRLAWKHP